MLLEMLPTSTEGFSIAVSSQENSVPTSNTAMVDKPPSAINIPSKDRLHLAISVFQCDYQYRVHPGEDSAPMRSLRGKVLMHINARSKLASMHGNCALFLRDIAFHLRALLPSL
jgi:hypothetical protein